MRIYFLCCFMVLKFFFIVIFQGLSRTGLVGNRIITIRKKDEGFPYTFVGISKPNTDIVETVIRYKDIGTSG